MRRSVVASPLRLAAAVVAEGALQDAVQGHEAHVFEQLKGLIAFGVSFPFVLAAGRQPRLHLARWLNQRLDSLSITTTRYVLRGTLIIYVPA